MKLTRRQVSELLGVSTKTVGEWQREDGFPAPTRQGRNLIYDGAATIAWWHARQIARLVKTQDGYLDPIQERAALDRAKRLQVELAMRARSEELVEARDVITQFRHAAITTQTAILSVPDRLAAVVAAEGDPDVVHSKLKQELESALSVLADRRRELAAEAEAVKEVPDG